jgi:hypothetical protein
MLALCVSPAHTQARWGIAGEVGMQRYWGASGPLAGSDDLALRPYRPTYVGLRFDRDLGVFRVGVGVRYAQCAVGGEFEGGATIFTNGFVLVEFAPEAATALTRLGTGAVVRGFAGPVISVWGPPDDNTRTRLGVRLGLELEAPLGAGVGAITRVQGGLAASALDEADVPPGYEVRSMPSAGVSLGLRVGL